MAQTPAKRARKPIDPADIGIPYFQQDYRPMTKTPAQRKAAERSRKTEQGLREVRGIWLPPHLHSRLKEYVKATKVFQP